MGYSLKVKKLGRRVYRAQFRRFRNTNHFRLRIVNVTAPGHDLHHPLGFELAERAFGEQQFRPVGEKFRGPAFIRLHVGKSMAYDTMVRLAKRGQRQRIRGGTVADEKDLGVKLEVTPHINPQGDIVVDLKPEIKDFVGIQTLDASRGIVAPIFSTREAAAEVMIRDGDTIMLGGLITKDIVDKENKIPFLGDIPLLGDYLFSKNEKVVERTELIIFITVHLVKDKWDTHLDPTTAFVPMPVPKDAEVFMAVPETKKRKKKWWELW